MTSHASAADTDDRPVLRLRSPTDVCEAVPYLLGFEPARSLVAISLRGQRKRAGLTMRLDLPDATGAPVAADLVVTHLRRDGASAAVVVAYADAGEPSPDAVVQAVIDGCLAAGIAVAEALRVADGRWTSYSCAEACCPPEGTPLRDRLAEPSVCGATMTAEGRQVLASRSALEGTIAPIAGLLGSAMRARLESELDTFLAAVRDERSQAYADATVRLVRAWIRRLHDGDALPVDDAARMIIGMLDREVRDQCLGGGIGTVARSEPPLTADALELWRELVRRALLPGTAAPVATLLAACAYLDHGQGALANVALDRALADEPAYVMARYLRAMLEGGLAPTTVRQWMSEPGHGSVRSATGA